MSSEKGFWKTVRSANSTVARTSVVSHIFPYFLALIISVVVLAIANTPEWLIVSGVSGIAFLLVVYVIAFVFCLIFDRDSLRSERFHLDKMMIERGAIGDSTKGLFTEIGNTGVLKQINQPPSKNLALNAKIPKSISIFEDARDAGQNNTNIEEE
jgi:hypothetical protein